MVALGVKKMIFLRKVEEEHENIERELVELETIIQDSKEEINYANLIHVLKKLYLIWDSHEIREEGAFKIFEKEQIKVPVETMLFDHQSLKIHKEKIKKALESGSEFKTKEALYKDLKKIIELIRKHLQDEDNFLYSLDLESVFSEEEKLEIDRRFGI
jgi:hemerythrin-like domain-containing protein